MTNKTEILDLIENQINQIINICDNQTNIIIDQSADIKISAALLKKAKGNITINHSPKAEVKINPSEQIEPSMQLKFISRQLRQLFDQLKRGILNDLNAISIENYEKIAVQNALEKVNGNKTKAAELLGIKRNSIYHKLKRLGLDNEM